MRIRLPLRRSVFFLAALAVALVLFLPLRLALGWFGMPALGVSAREARGSVWAGSLTEAQVGEAAVGDLDVGLSPVQLLVGRARVDVERDGGDDLLSGAIGLSRNSTGVDDLTGVVPVGAALAPLPISAVGFTDFSVRFVGGRCQSADGAVRAILSGDIAGLNLAQGLAGAARCDDGRLLLPLAGQSGEERLDLRLSEGGAWTADLSVRTGDPALIGRLTAAGFAPGRNGYALTISGGASAAPAR